MCVKTWNKIIYNAYKRGITTHPLPRPRYRSDHPRLLSQLILNFTSGLQLSKLDKNDNRYNVSSAHLQEIAWRKV